MNRPNVLVIIVTWNKKEFLLALFASLNTLDYPRERLHFLLVDNASADGTADAIEDGYPDVAVIRNRENLGGTGGFNTGLAWGLDQPADKFDYFWLLDNDVVVHRSALAPLVDILEHNPDVAVAGSTIMQLDYPWRVNEMGAFLDRRCGGLLWQQHHSIVPAWRNRDMATLLHDAPELDRHLVSVQPVMDVDYVAAASLVVRTSAAREAGLWDDFFLHFDDVDWCLRIAQRGHRIVASSASLVWHMSAVSKVRTWVLYYDNRNLLYLLQTHGRPGAVRCATRKIFLKAAYYTTIGKGDLGRLLIDALDDFANGVKGKKSIALDTRYHPLAAFDGLLQDPQVNHILLPSTLDLDTSGIRESLLRALERRSDLEVHCLLCDKHEAGWQQLPCARTITIDGRSLRSASRLLKLRGKYDLVVQSDYRIKPLLSWLGREVVFVNLDSFARRPRPTLSSLMSVAGALLGRMRRLF